MRELDLTQSAPAGGDPARTARLARHLKARLEDFGPGGPEVRFFDENAGLVSARFPGHETGWVLRRLEERGVRAGEEDGVLFRLSPGIRFEDLDYLWGCLFEIL